jgi:hypothetical protein
MQSLPACEVRSGLLVARPSAERDLWRWSLVLEIYMIPKDGTRVTLPFHQCEAAFELPGQISLTPLVGIKLFARKSEESPARATTT